MTVTRVAQVTESGVVRLKDGTILLFMYIKRLPKKRSLGSTYTSGVVSCFIEPLFVILQMGFGYGKGVEGVARTLGPAPVLTRRDGAQLTRQRTAST